jgi:hypothetical protein
VKAVCTIRDSLAVVGAAGSAARALRLARLVEGELIKCGRGARATTNAGRDIRAALDAKRPIIVDVDHRGLTPGWGIEAFGHQGLAGDSMISSRFDRRMSASPRPCSPSPPWPSRLVPPATYGREGAVGRAGAQAQTA